MDVIDLSYLKSVADGDEELIKTLVDIFLDQLNEFEIGFTKYMEDEDWVSMASLAHKAKSSILSMGMSELGVAMKKLEMLSKLLYTESSGADKAVSDGYRSQIESAPDEIRIWVNDNKSKKNIQDLIFFYILQSEKAKADLNKAFG